MAVYEGSAGIKALRDKINLKSKMLVGESLEKIATHMVDESPLGAKYYKTGAGAISVIGLVQNDQGDFKNSWMVGIGEADLNTRGADVNGTAAVADAIIKSKLYNLQEDTFVTNNVDHAQMVEGGWNDNPEYGWKAKGGYHVVGNNIGAAEAILEVVAQKVSKL